ncbi:hypothetical protein [Mesorhizobium xinjiangense]|uniref:hypothetical protein n=1 Tax=Mesorhizobium xinjiangense TaxID=2678685 RepID=UPI0012ED5700|nr:hypothetical protein [Mesorhizobium xinjiangense]
MKAWLTTTEFASLAGMSKRRARKICQQIGDGHRFHWDGAALEVGVIHGRPGRSGKNYIVKACSLPDYLQERLKASQAALEGRSLTISGSPAARERTWWLHILGPALEHPKGSAERKAALDAIAAVRHLDWHGRRIPISLRTLQRRLARMEGEGSIGPLARAGRADKGKKRVVVSRAWDKAVPFDDATKAKLAENLRQHIRGLIKAGMKGKNLCFFASKYLREMTEAHGFRPNDEAVLTRACKVPTHLCDAEAIYKKVHRHRTDRKASVDAGPHITRTTKGLRPMEWVVADVHHCNVLVEKESGRLGTAKAISFLDVATRRVWTDLVFFDGRGGVRNIDVIETFKGMAADPAFGLPELIYFDNGKEYNFADFLDDALQLAIPLAGGDGRQSRIVRAQPYNAKAKPIEAWFGHFEQQYLSLCQGYRGDDIVNPKRPALGKLPAPYLGGFDAFRTRFFGLLKGYEHIPQRGDLAGRSPAEAFAEHVNTGWSAAVAEPAHLNSVFARPVTRRLVGGRFELDGRKGGWNCPALDRYLGDTIVVRVPIYHAYNEVNVYTPEGAFIGIASPEEVYSFGDPRGARHSARRKKEHAAALRRLEKSAPTIDAAALIVAHGEEQMPMLPNAPRAVVSVTTGERTANVIVPEGKPQSPEQALREERREIQKLREQVAANLKRAAS